MDNKNDYSLIKQGDAVQYDVMEFVCDTRDDVAKLPVDNAAGSTCIVLADSSVWMLGNNKVWQEI